MLKTLMTLLLFAVVISPALTQELVVRQVNGTSVFARNKEILTIREVVQLLPKGSKEQRLLRGSRFHGGVAIATAGAGLVYLSVGILQATNFEDDESTDALNKLSIGLGFLSLSWRSFEDSKRKARRAVDMYNISPAPEAPDIGIHLRFGPQPNGMGLALQF